MCKEAEQVPGAEQYGAATYGAERARANRPRKGISVLFSLGIE